MNLFIRYTFLLSLICHFSLAQIIPGHWPNEVKNLIQFNGQKHIVSLQGDTLFRIDCYDTLVEIQDQYLVYEISKTIQGPFIVSLYDLDERGRKGNRIRKTFYREDTSKYSVISYHANGKISGIVDYHLNGVLWNNQQFTDSSKSHFWQDELSRVSRYRFWKHGELKETNIVSDTVIYGIRARKKLHLRLPHDTLYYEIEDENKTVWQRVAKNHRITRYIEVRDTLCLSTQGITFHKSLATDTSIFNYYQHSLKSYSENYLDRRDKTGYSKYYENGQLKRESITQVNKHGLETKTYDLVEGKRIISAIRKDISRNRVRNKNYQNGKLVSKAITEFGPKGQIIKVTSWIKGKKSVVDGKDLIVSNHDRCGMNIRNPRQYVLRIDSINLSLNGRSILKPQTRKLYFKFDGKWLNYSEFEFALRKNYSGTILMPEPGIELKLDQNNRKIHSKIKGPFKESELFKTPIEVEGLAFDDLEIDQIKPDKQALDIRLFLSISGRQPSLSGTLR